MSGRLYRQDDGRLAISIRYDPKLVEQLRDIPGRKYNSDDRTWSVPFNVVAATAMMEVAIAAKVACEPPELVQEIKLLAAQADENTAASRAATASAVVPDTG